MPSYTETMTTNSDTSLTSALPTASAGQQDSSWTPPTWLLGLALSWFAFGFVLATVLFLAQFPERFPWLAWITRWPDNSHRKHEGASKRRKGRARATSSAVAQHPREESGLRLRKPEGLTVDTGADRRGNGLGILGLGSAEAEPRSKGKKVKKRVSFDLLRSDPPPHRSREAATAPLPSTNKFRRRRASRHRRRDRPLAPPKSRLDGPVWGAEGIALFRQRVSGQGRWGGGKGMVGCGE